MWYVNKVVFFLKNNQEWNSDNAIAPFPLGDQENAVGKSTSHPSATQLPVFKLALTY